MSSESLEERHSSQAECVGFVFDFLCKAFDPAHTWRSAVFSRSRKASTCADGKVKHTPRVRQRGGLRLRRRQNLEACARSFKCTARCQVAA
eukprot:5626349-Pleurochrysis_carterae.AAC.1